MRFDLEEGVGDGLVSYSGIAKDTAKQRTGMLMEAEIAVVHRQVKECQELQTTIRK